MKDSNSGIEREVSYHDLWNSVDDFQRLLVEYRWDGGKGNIYRALPQFGHERIAPLLKSTTSFNSLDDTLQFLRTHFGHALSSTHYYPEWSVSVFPNDVLEAAEDTYLDTQVYPRIFPNREHNGSDEFDPKVRLKGLSRFPSLISDFLRVDHAAYNRMINGIDRIERTVLIARSTGMSSDALSAELNKQAEENERNSKPARDVKFERIRNGMQSIARRNVDILFGDVYSSEQYRDRLRFLHTELGEATESFNNSIFLSRYDTVSSDFQRQWEVYLQGQLRQFYLTPLLDRAFGRLSIEPPKTNSFIARIFGILGF